MRSVKDGCSPQGQCGCCTVLIDGAARVACVTPVRRVSGRSVVTVEGLGDLEAMCQSFLRQGASQCGFCTPGILCRIAGLGAEPSRHDIETSLLAHLCRCTGWRSIVEAVLEPVVDTPNLESAGLESPNPASVAVESVRARLEGRVAQRTGVAVVAGRGGFSDDTAPAGCLVAVPDGRGGWALGESLPAARVAAGKIQGRRSGRDLGYPLEVPPGDWDLTLQTTWVEPGYLEPDSSWCVPGGEPVGPTANGGAFGGKTRSIAPVIAKALADEHLRPVRVVFSREDVVRLGPKRPPMAAGARLDGSGAVRVVSADGIAERIRLASPKLMVEEVEVNGPPVSSAIRAAGWAEAAVLNAACRGGERGLPARHGHRAGGRPSHGGGRPRRRRVARGCPPFRGLWRPPRRGRAALLPLGSRPYGARLGMQRRHRGRSGRSSRGSHHPLLRDHPRPRHASGQPAGGSRRADRTGQRIGRGLRGGGRCSVVGSGPPSAMADETRNPNMSSHDPSSPTPVGPYTPVVRAGGWLVCSGQLALRDGALIEGGVAEQVSQCVANLATVLEGQGASLRDVVKTTVFLSDIEDYAEMNEAYVAAFGAHRPARSAFAVAGLPRDGLVEIEAWAYLEQRLEP